MSSWPLGPIFNFEKEIAVSPFVNAQGAGFNYENRVVVRLPILMTLLNDERTAKFQALSTVTHEMYHVTGFRAPYPRSYLEAYWEEETAGDICRFTETTRTFEEIAREFFLNFDSPVLAEVNKHLGYEHFPAPPYSLEQMMEKMAKNGVIQKIGDGSFRCSSFEEGKQWLV